VKIEEELTAPGTVWYKSFTGKNTEPSERGLV
jgi:hypothetical protein